MRRKADNNHIGANLEPMPETSGGNRSGLTLQEIHHEKPSD
jgi:hypothetical protein